MDFSPSNVSYSSPLLLLHCDLHDRRTFQYPTLLTHTEAAVFQTSLIQCTVSFVETVSSVCGRKQLMVLSKEERLYYGTVGMSARGFLDTLGSRTENCQGPRDTMLSRYLGTDVLRFSRFSWFYTLYMYCDTVILLRFDVPNILITICLLQRDKREPRERAMISHGNMSAIEGQERDVIKTSSD